MGAPVRVASLAVYLLRFSLLIAFAICCYPGKVASSADTSATNNTLQPIYQLDSVEVTRKYKDWDFNVTPGKTDNPGTQSGGVGQSNFKMGWDISFTPSDGCAGRSHATANLDITALPTTLEAGSKATFAARMSGEWQTACYEVVRDHTLQLSGIAGGNQWSVDDKPNGSYSGAVEASNTITVPQGGGQLSYDIDAKINFGSDNWGDMNIHMVYKCTQNCSHSDQDAEPVLAARLLCDDPLKLTPGAVSETCIICIGGWRRNTEDRVEVVFPDQLDASGRHDSQVWVFAGGNDKTGVIGPIGMLPWHMSGYYCPDKGSFSAGEFPWTFLVSAGRFAPPGPSTVRIVVRQKKQGSSNFNEVKINLNAVVLGAPSKSGVPPKQNSPTGSGCLAYDPGASIQDKKSHMDWAKSQSKNTLISNLDSKIDHLYGCPQFDSASFAKLFADLSKMLIQYASDPECYEGDKGAASTDWNSHKSWADGLVSQGKKDKVLGNLKWKIEGAMGCLNGNQQAQLFADASVIIATSAP